MVSPTAATITLRQAIQSAASGDTIVINPGINPTLNSQFGGALQIPDNESLTIIGQGANSTTISAGSVGIAVQYRPSRGDSCPRHRFSRSRGCAPRRRSRSTT